MDTRRRETRDKETGMVTDARTPLSVSGPEPKMIWCGHSAMPKTHITPHTHRVGHDEGRSVSENANGNYLQRIRHQPGSRPHTLARAHGTESRGSAHGHSATSRRLDTVPVRPRLDDPLLP